MKLPIKPPTPKRKRKKKEQTITLPNGKVITKEKYDYLNDKYGVGNWKILTKEEFLYLWAQDQIRREFN